MLSQYGAGAKPNYSARDKTIIASARRLARAHWKVATPQHRETIDAFRYDFGKYAPFKTPDEKALFDAAYYEWLRNKRMAMPLPKGRIVGGKKRHSMVELVHANELRAGDVVFPRYLMSKTQEPATIVGEPVPSKDRFGTELLAFPAKAENQTGNIHLGNGGQIHRLRRIHHGGKRRHGAPSVSKQVADLNKLLRK
jgi:hypothetical protein